MENLTIALALVLALFPALLAVKKYTSRSFCVLCLSVSGTWLTLLTLYLTGLFEDPLIIALLIGQSITGIYYLLEKQLEEKYHVFKLPYILTATAAAYLILRPVFIMEAFAMIAVTWLFFAFLFLYRENSRVRTLFQEAVECCKDW